MRTRKEKHAAQTLLLTYHQQSLSFHDKEKADLLHIERGVSRALATTSPDQVEGVAPCRAGWSSSSCPPPQPFTASIQLTCKRIYVTAPNGEIKIEYD